MPRTRPLRALRVLSVAAMLSLVLVATASSWGTLCIGADGHVAFEAVTAGDCFGEGRGEGSGEGVSGASGTVASARPAEDAWPCCGPCTDVSQAGARWLPGGAPDLDPGPALATARSEDLGRIASPHPAPAARVRDAAVATSLRIRTSSILRC